MYYHYGKWDRGCPLLRGNKCTITMGSGTEVVLFSEVTNVLSLWEMEIWGLQLVLCSEVVLFVRILRVCYQRFHTWSL